MRIHSNHLGMISHYLEACHKGHFIKKIIILKNKLKRAIGVLQRDVNLSLERRAVAMALRLNNIEFHTDGISRISVLPHPNIREAIDHKSNPNRILPKLFGKSGSSRE